MTRKLKRFKYARLDLGVGIVLGGLWLVAVHGLVEPPLYTDQLRWMYVFEEEDGRVDRAVEMGVLHLPYSVTENEFWLGSDPARILVTPPTGKVGSLMVVFTAADDQGNPIRVSALGPMGEVEVSKSVDPKTLQMLEVPLQRFVDTSPFPKHKLQIECVVFGVESKAPVTHQRCARIVDLRWKQIGQES